MADDGHRRGLDDPLHRQTLRPAPGLHPVSRAHARRRRQFGAAVAQLEQPCRFDHLIDHGERVCVERVGTTLVAAHLAGVFEATQEAP